MPANVFYAEEGSVILSGCEVFATSGVDVTAEVKEISITGGGRDVEAVRCFGNASYFDEKPQEPFECSLTVIKNDADFFALLGDSATDTSDPQSFTGDTTPRNQVRLIEFEWADTTASDGPAVRVTMASVFAVTKEMSLNATDHLEETINFKCLAKNYKEEATADRNAAALP